MRQSQTIIYLFILSLATMLMTGCTDLSDMVSDVKSITIEEGNVLILCEGNYNAGNASLSYYSPMTKTVENGVFKRVNDRKLGDTGQGITIYNNTAYITAENSGIIWGMNTSTMKVTGQLTATSNTKIINPRYVHVVSKEKAYVTDLYSSYINIFNPSTFAYTGSIDVSQAKNNGYCSTEEMVEWNGEVFVNCWSYSNKILVINTSTDALCDSIILSSWQPKSIAMDKNGKLWVITDGGYDDDNLNHSTDDHKPHLYRIDAPTRQTELDITLETDEANVQLALNSTKDVVYLINNDIYRMSVTADHLPVEPFIKAPIDNDGTRHKLYGIGINPQNNDIYVADAVDYRQAGMIYRYAINGTLIDQFRVGITPNHFAFTYSNAEIIPEEDEEVLNADSLLVDTIYEYMPAPGHQVNGYTVVGDFIHAGATMQEACDSVMSHFKKRYMVSLGAQGGYVIAGWDHDVLNSHGDYDIVIKGNPYSYQSEPGIIWVSHDDNGNGLPDDTWYELKGSEYGTENETINYAITYYKPTAAGQDIQWKDNQGGEGVVPYMKAWNTHDSYWQDWVTTEKDSEGREYRTYYGSRLKDTHTYEDGYTMEPPFKWGYVDNDGSDYFNNSAFKAMSGAMGYYKIDNAVTADGQPANLACINFIKIQTGQTGCSPNLGDISTEVYGIWEFKHDK